MNTMNPYRRRYTKTADRKTIRLILNIARAVLIVLTAAVLILTMFLSLNVGKERGNGVFGTKYFVISDAMMEPAYESGIIVGVREAAAYYAGDVIAFKSSSPDNYGSVTVRIIRSETVHNDRAAFVTYPNSTGVDDLSPAYAGDILGRVTSSHPALGAFYSFLRSAGGYMVMVLLPFMLLILCEILRFILLKPEDEASSQKQMQTQPQTPSYGTANANRPRVINSQSSQRYNTASAGTSMSDTARIRAMSETAQRKAISDFANNTDTANHKVMSDTAQRKVMSDTAQRKVMSDTAQHNAMSDTNLSLAIPKQTAKPAADTAEETTVWNKSDVTDAIEAVKERPTMTNSPNPRRPVYTSQTASARQAYTAQAADLKAYTDKAAPTGQAHTAAASGSQTHTAPSANRRAYTNHTASRQPAQQTTQRTSAQNGTTPRYR